MLEEDLRSPCTEEIAVFQAFSRVIRESSKHFVVMDTAPTGHTLLLLDATGSYHRDIMRHTGEPSSKMVTPMMRLQDPAQTKILIVTLPETTPVLEAAHLQSDLQRAGIEPWGWIINSSLAAAQTHQPLLQKRAQSEQQQIARVRDELSTRYAVVPMQATEPVGVEKLKRLCETADNSAAA
jgi:arsenite-transporting ATPase